MNETKGGGSDVVEGPYVLSNNPNPGSSKHELPTLEHVFRTHLLYDVGATDKLYCGLCGEVFMLIFAGMLGKQAQRCIPYLKDYFQFARPGVPAGRQPPRPTPRRPRMLQPATSADNADVNEHDYSSSAGSANSDINHQRHQ